MSNTEGVMAEVEEITLQYSIIARSCSAVFAVLEQLHYLNHFYQFSLQYFLDIFHSVLHDNKRLANETNHNVRRDIIVEDLFVTTYQANLARSASEGPDHAGHAPCPGCSIQDGQEPDRRAFWTSRVEGRDLSTDSRCQG